MNHWSLGAICLSCLLIPPITKRTIAPLVGYLISLGCSGYFKCSLWYDIWTSTLHLDGLELNRDLLDIINPCIPLPYHIRKLKIQYVRIQLNWIDCILHQLPKLHLSLEHATIDGECVGEQVYATLHEQQQAKDFLVGQKQALAQWYTDTIESYINKTGPETKAVPPPPFVSQFIDHIIDYLHLDIVDLKWFMRPETPANEAVEPSTSGLKLSCSNLMIHPSVDAGIQSSEKIIRDVQILELHLQLNNVPLIGFDSVEANVQIPSILSYLIVPMPLPSKTLRIRLLARVLTLNVDITTLPTLMDILDSITRYGQFWEQMQTLVDQACSSPTKDDLAEYEKLYKIRIDSQKVVNYESKWSLDHILDARTKCFKWNTRHKKLKTLDDVKQVAEQAQEDQMPLRLIDISFSVGQIEPQFKEQSISIASIPIAEVDVDLQLKLYTLQEEDSQETSFELRVNCNRIDFIVNASSFGMDRSILLRHDPHKHTIELEMLTMGNGKLKLDVRLDGIQTFLHASAIQHFLLYLDRLLAALDTTQSSYEIHPLDEASSVAPTASTLAEQTSSSVKTPSITLFSGSLMDIGIQLNEIGICLVHQFRSRQSTAATTSSGVGQMLELTFSAECRLQSSKEDESLRFHVKQIALVPRVFDCTEEFQLHVHDSIEDSLLAPLQLEANYSHTQHMSLPEQHQAIVSEQTIHVKMEDIVVSFTHTNLAILVGALAELSRIEFTTAEQQQKHQDHRDQLLKKQQARALKLRLFQMKQLYDRIDVDHSNDIDVFEMTKLLSESAMKIALLKEETEALGQYFFTAIDEDGSGGIQFEEFEHFVIQEIDGCRLDGFLNKRAFEYQSLDRFTELFHLPYKDHELLLEDENLQARFWKLYEEQLGVSKNHLHDQAIDLVQKKLIRWLQNYEIAQKYWYNVISPELQPHIDNLSSIQWIIDPLDSCGGLCDFELMSAMVMDEAALGAIRESKGIPPSTTRHSRASRHLSIANRLSIRTNFELGDIRILLRDQTLPLGIHRGNVFLGHMKCFASFDTLLLPQLYDDLHDSLFFHVNSSWSLTFTFDLHASCYCDSANCMESIIEPWQAALAMSKNQHEEGFAVLAEADRRFQLNITASLMQLIQLIFQILQGQATSISEEHEHALVHTEQDGCHVTNYTGIPLLIHVGDGNEEGTIISPKFSALFKYRTKEDSSESQTQLDESAQDKQIAVGFEGGIEDTESLIEEQHPEQEADWMPEMISIEIPNWGKREAIGMTSISSALISIPQDCDAYNTEIPSVPILLHQAAVPGKGCSLVIKSNVYIVNHTQRAFSFRLSYLSNLLEDDENMEEEQTPVELQSKQKRMLSLRVCISEAECIITENDDHARSTKRFIKLKSELFRMEPSHIRNHNSEQEDDDEDGEKSEDEVEKVSSKNVYDALSPDVYLVRKTTLIGVEWEIQVLPLFIFRNSLPYDIEYVAIECNEVDQKALSLGNETKTRILASSISISLSSQQKIRRGQLLSGEEHEMACVSQMYLYVMIRLVGKSEAQDVFFSPWCEPILITLLGSPEEFRSCSQETTFGETKSKFAEHFSVSTQAISTPTTPRLVSFSVPYWIVNNTGLKLDYCSVSEVEDDTPARKSLRQSIKSRITRSRSSIDESPNAVVKNMDSAFCAPTMAHLGSNRISFRPKSYAMRPTPSAWSSIIPVQAIPKEMNEDDQAMCEWSEAVNASAVNTQGELRCGNQVFGLSIHSMSGIFLGTKLIQLGPRYIIQNQTCITIDVKTFSSTTATGFVSAQAQKLRDRIPSFGDKHRDFLNRHRSREPTRLPPGHNALIVKIDPLDRSGALSPLASSGTLHPFVLLAHKYHIYDSEGDENDRNEFWSSAVPVSAAGNIYCEIQNVNTRQVFLIEVNIQVVNEHIYIILRDSSKYPPYRIENASSLALRIQRKGDEQSQYLEPGRWISFAWHNPVEKDRQVEVRVDKTKYKASYNVDSIGMHKPIILEDTSYLQEKEDQAQLQVQVTPSCRTRVLRIMDKTSYEEHTAFSNVSEADDLRLYYASSLNIRIQGVGLSLCDTYPREIAFLSIDVITLSKVASTLEWDFQIFHVQLDNMLPHHPRYPVVLEPLGSGYDQPSVGAKNQQLLPTLQLKMAATYSESINAYELLEFRLATLSIKLDIGFLLLIASVLSEPFSNVEAFETQDTTLVHRLLNAPLKSPIGPQSESDQLYIEMFRLHALQLELEWHITRANIEQPGTTGVMALVMTLVSLIGSNLSGSPTLRFSEIVVSQCFTTSASLIDRLVQSYSRQGIVQVYRILGSTNLLGDPIGLVENLGTGVAEFFRITKDELSGDSGTRGEGLKVLGKTIIKTGANSAAKITGCLDRMVTDFIHDEATGAKQRKKSKNAPKGDDTFATAFGREVAGIVTKPFAGARKGGVSGFVEGTAKGIFGPAAVILKAVTSTSHSMAVGVEATMVDRAPFGGRRRKARRFVDGALHTKTLAESPSALKLHILSASALVASGSCDVLCIVYVDGKRVFRTKTIYNTVNPQWNESKALTLKGTEKVLTFAVKDSYGALDSTIGRVRLTLETLYEDFRRTTSVQSPLMQWALTGIQPTEDAEENDDQSSRGKSKAREYYIETTTRTRPPVHMYNVIVTVLEARKLRHTTGLLSSKPSAYVSVSNGKTKQRTRTRPTDANPTFDESFTFPFVPAKDKSSLLLRFTVKSKGLLTDEILGKASFEVDGERDIAPQVLWVDLRPKGTKATIECGSLRIKTELVASCTSASSVVLPRVGRLRVLAEFN